MGKKANLAWPSLPPRESNALESSVRNLQRGMLSVLGHYKVGSSPIIYSPLQTKDRWPIATKRHEEIHQTLFLNTTYGFFCQVLAKLAQAGYNKDEYCICFENQLITHEATATYIEISTIAATVPDQVHDAIALLPTEYLKEFPYRELFDLIAKIIPINFAKDIVTLSAHTDVILAIAVYALNCDILSKFNNPSDFCLEAFNKYIEINSPDNRFKRIFSIISQNDELQHILHQAKKNNELLRQENYPISKSKQLFENLVEMITRLDQNEILITNTTRDQQSHTFFESWNSYVEEITKRELRKKVFDLDDEEPVSVHYINDWYNKFPEADIMHNLTIKKLKNAIIDARQSNLGFWCNIAIKFRRVVHIGILPYPLGENNNPISTKYALDYIESFGDPIGNVFSTDKIIKIMLEFPEFPQIATFSKGCWKLWDKVTKNLQIMKNSVLINIEVELSKKYIDSLLEFYNLKKACEYFVFEVDHEKYAACFSNPQRPGIYAIQSLIGTVSLNLFERIIHKKKINRMRDCKSKIPHLSIIGFVSSGLFLE